MTTANNGNNTLLICAALVVGAMMYSRQRTAVAAQRYPLGAGSMSGANGSGAAQVVGGITQGVLNYMSNWGGSGSSFVPDVYNGTATTQNSIGTFGVFGGTADDPWYG